MGDEPAPDLGRVERLNALHIPTHLFNTKNSPSKEPTILDHFNSFLREPPPLTAAVLYYY